MARKLKSDKVLFLAEVGDSRAYLVRGSEMKQLTKDQSLVNQLIEAGHLTDIFQIGKLLQHERILETLPDGVVLLDADNSIIWGNTGDNVIDGVRPVGEIDPEHEDSLPRSTATVAPGKRLFWNHRP